MRIGHDRTTEMVGFYRNEDLLYTTVASTNKDGSSKLKKYIGHGKLNLEQSSTPQGSFFVVHHPQIGPSLEPHANKLQILASNVIYSATTGRWIIFMEFFYAISFKGITFEMEVAGPLYIYTQVLAKIAQYVLRNTTTSML